MCFDSFFYLQDLNGLTFLRFWYIIGWVNKRLKPGHTPQPPASWETTFKNAIKLQHVLLSPNFLWLSISLLVYTIFPYDLITARTLAPDWILARFAINFGVTFSYYAFWELTLYVGKWSQRHNLEP